ncbi:hypothetical protein SKAU_G00256220 [Synaphobranchus kaupii]|uniref:Uncharacterized protein n=1 Tax=Synaphobranchus kaupii TaxID=118154 RepID=A0A9Q1F467_SYNKA|nr:hypothetical protein SKAU_G00256220 [Synaphobranchus kaupii]
MDGWRKRVGGEAQPGKTASLSSARTTQILRDGVGPVKPWERTGRRIVIAPGKKEKKKNMMDAGCPKHNGARLWTARNKRVSRKGDAIQCLPREMT